MPRHVWAAVWYEDGCWHAAPTAALDVRGVGETTHEALADLALQIERLERLEPEQRRSIRDGTPGVALPRSYLLARLAVADDR